MYFLHGEHEAAGFDIGIGESARSAQFAAGALEKMDVFRMIDDPHGVCFAIGNAMLQPAFRISLFQSIFSVRDVSGPSGGMLFLKAYEVMTKQAQLLETGTQGQRQ